MHRNLKVALGGAALSLGVVIGLPTAAFAVDCPAGQVAATYPDRCVTPPGTLPDNPPITGVTPPAPGTGVTPPAPGTVVTPPAPVTVTPPAPINENVTSPGAGGGTSAGGTTGGRAVSSGRGAVGTLPFTGDEVLVLGLAGAAALAAGTALTVAGRRRGATTA